MQGAGGDLRQRKLEVCFHVRRLRCESDPLRPALRIKVCENPAFRSKPIRPMGTPGNPVMPRAHAPATPVRAFRLALSSGLAAGCTAVSVGRTKRRARRSMLLRALRGSARPWSRTGRAGLMARSWLAGDSAQQSLQSPSARSSLPFSRRSSHLPLAVPCNAMPSGPPPLLSTSTRIT